MSNGPARVLNAPVNLGAMAANLENNVGDIKSIWVMQRDDTLVKKNPGFGVPETVDLFLESGCEEARKGTTEATAETGETLHRSGKNSSRP